VEICEIIKPIPNFSSPTNALMEKVVHGHSIKKILKKFEKFHLRILLISEYENEYEYREDFFSQL